MEPGTSDSITEPDGLQAREPLLGKHVAGEQGGAAQPCLTDLLIWAVSQL